MNNCLNCNAELNGNFCSNCGQVAKLKRIDWHYITHEIEHVLHFDRGILYTIKELIISPGESVKNFINNNRSRLVKPIIFIIITSLIYSFINYIFHLEDGYIKFEEVKKTTTGVIFKWVSDHYGYANIILGIFIAFWAKIFFRKYHYNLFEILILLCFVMGIGMLIFSIFSILKGFFHVDLMQIASILGIGYCVWAIGQFYDKTKIVNYFKAFAAYMLGMISFSILAVAIGSLIDIIVKK